MHGRARFLWDWPSLASLAVALALQGCAKSVPVDTHAAVGDAVATPSTWALTLTGTPTSTVAAGSRYLFQPTSSQSGASVLFTIVSQPKWAAFNADTGELSGTPTMSDVGTTSGIMILVSNASSTASIGPFTVTVNDGTGSPAPTPTGAATLTWVAPKVNADGSPLTDLAGFHIHYGTSTSRLDQEIALTGAASTAFVVTGLAPATYYFAVTAFSSSGLESAPSKVVSKTL